MLFAVLISAGIPKGMWRKDMLKYSTIVAGLLTMLAGAGNAFAGMIAGSVDGKYTDFEPVDIWRLVSDARPDAVDKKKASPGSDKKTVQPTGKSTKKDIKLEEKAKLRELNDIQVKHLLKLDEQVMKSPDDKKLLDRLLLAGLVEQKDPVVKDEKDGGITRDKDTDKKDLIKARVPEPSTLALLALGLPFLVAARGRRTQRPQV